jgi:hypothetical protein
VQSDGTTYITEMYNLYSSHVWLYRAEVRTVMCTKLYLIKHIWIMYSTKLFSPKSILCLHVSWAEGLFKLLKCFDVKQYLRKMYKPPATVKAWYSHAWYYISPNILELIILFSKNKLCQIIVFLFYIYFCYQTHTSILKKISAGNWKNTKNKRLFIILFYFFLDKLYLFMWINII